MSKACSFELEQCRPSMSATWTKMALCMYCQQSCRALSCSTRARGLNICALISNEAEQAKGCSTGHCCIPMEPVEPKSENFCSITQKRELSTTCTTERVPFNQKHTALHIFHSPQQLSADPCARHRGTDRAILTNMRRITAFSGSQGDAASIRPSVANLGVVPLCLFWRHRAPWPCWRYLDARPHAERTTVHRAPD